MADLARLTSALADKFRIERELGAGEMSHIFVATELANNRTVVIKVVAPEHAGELFADRFSREVKFASRLKHANIVPLLSAGDANGIAYYTMPFVEGRSLRQRLASGDAIPLAEATQILRDVLKALAYAHDQSVVHRDIKPEHVLLSSGKAVVTDFGIAKAISASRTMEISTESPITVSATLTSVGSTPGTPAYTAPEQAVGSVVDARTDLYAWGMMAYELLAGAHPFADRTTPQTMVAAQLTERPAPIGEVNPAVPEAFAGIIMRALEKDADDRPASATEVLAVIDGTAPTAPPAAPRVSTRRTSRDVKVVPAAERDASQDISRRMGVAAALLVFALLVWGWFSRQAAQRNDVPNASAPASPPVAAPETRPDAPLESPRDTRPDRGPGTRMEKP